jgi:hypothetical protein
MLLQNSFYNFKLLKFNFLYLPKYQIMHFLYFDAGLGAMLIQAIVAAVAGIALFYKSIKYKIRSIFGMDKNTTENEVFDDINMDDSTIENPSKDDN